MKARRFFCTAGLVVGFFALAARADDVSPAVDIGRSIVVVNDVEGQAADAPVKRIAVNDDIVFQEDITTGGDAKTVLEFHDGSTFEIGPNAAVRIDSFIFNPEESTSHKAVSVTRGVFRYVSAFVASDQDTKIATPSGIMGIRGSVAEGIVDPSVPDFLYLGEGSATFSNSAGSSTLQPGNSIAVPSATTPPMAPAAMPAPIAAQALQAIEVRLPPRSALANRPASDETWLKRVGQANLVPATEQQRLAVAAAGTSRPLPSAAGVGGLAGELALLNEANRLNLFSGRQTVRTPEQTAFLARAAREHPNAETTLRRFNEQSRTMHTANVRAGTEFVIRGVGHAAPSAEVMRRVTTAAARANPGAAALIQRHASEAYHGPDREKLTGRPGSERTANRPADRQTQRPAERSASERAAAQRPAIHQPNEFERRQQVQERRQPGFERQQQGFQRQQGGPNARQQGERRPPGAQPPRQPQQQQRQTRQPPQKGEPRKKGDERDQRR